MDEALLRDPVQARLSPWDLVVTARRSNFFSSPALSPSHSFAHFIVFHLVSIRELKLHGSRMYPEISVHTLRLQLMQMDFLWYG
jgi:hypothetical protein